MLEHLDENDPIEHKKAKYLAKGAVVIGAGWVSNLFWAGAIFLNRYSVESGKSAVLPAIGLTTASFAAEYGATHLATAGDLDVEWSPKRRFTIGMKKAISKFPLAVTSWRGAASGVVLDEVTGREVTGPRRAAHAAVYSTIMGAWATEPGSQAIEKGWDATEHLYHSPLLAVAVGATALAASYIGLQRTQDPKASELS